MGAAVRVLLVDDHPLALAGVRSVLTGHHQVVGEADNPASAIELIKERVPEVVLIDVRMPGGGGLAVVRAVHPLLPQVRFLALSASDDPRDVIALIRAGAVGYLTKDASDHELREAVSRAAEGQPVFSRSLAAFVREAFAEEAPEATDPELDLLTNREVELAVLLARGYTNKEIATDLGISVKTVETHITNILHKLQLTNRRSVIRWADERGYGVRHWV